MHFDHTCCKANGATGACRRSYLVILAPILCLLYTCKHSLWELGFETREGTAVLWCPKSRMCRWPRRSEFEGLFGSVAHSSTLYAILWTCFHVISQSTVLGYFHLQSDRVRSADGPVSARARKCESNGRDRVAKEHTWPQEPQNVPCHRLQAQELAKPLVTRIARKFDKGLAPP